MREPREFWTRKDENKCLNMRHKGFTVNEIATELGRSPEAVRLKLARIKKGYHNG